MEGIGSGEVLLTSAFIAYETAFAFSQYLPSIMTIRSFVDTQAKLRMIREGELVAGAFAGTFAVIFSLILRSWLPLALAGAAVLVTVGTYEWALRGCPAVTGVRAGGTPSMVGDVVDALPASNGW